MDRILTHLLSAPLDTTKTQTVEAWWTSHVRIADAWPDPADLALAAGFAADRPAWAFASGYRAALAALVPSLDPHTRAALGVTEDSGNTPRAMATTVRDDGAHLVIEGAKSFVTLGTHADELLVLAREGEDDAGRARLALVRIPRDARGVTLTAFPPPPFVPEVPHARATFSAVHVPHDARLEGDGWSDYVKPFRTVEDAHVHAALLGYVVAVARRAAWPRDVLTRLASFVAAAHTLCEADRDAPATHVALAGLLAETRALAVDDGLWDRVDEATRAVWTRDRALLAVAEKARAARLERAFEALGPISTRNS